MLTRICKGNMRYHQDTIKRLWARVAKGPGCWEWQGCRTVKGYGRMNFRVDGNLHQVYVHRMVWELERGEIPDGLSLCHHCDNPRCVRPDHIFVGTNSDNVRDGFSKGRFPAGESSKLSKLTESQVVRIRLALVRGHLTQREIAAQFGIGQQNVSAIKRGKSWNWVK